MCGFLVNISNENINKSNFLNSNELIHSRGPDSTEYISGDSIETFKFMFGFKRLAILDLNKNANQPMQDLKKNYILVFNGEIYNFKVLRTELEKKGYKFNTSHSDTEVILHGYKAWGEKVVNKLEGQFSFVIFDKKRKKIFAARDRVGQKPLYYSIDKNNIIFSSSIKSILQLKQSNDINLENINTYLQLGVFPSPSTAYKNINKLKNAEFLELQIDNIDSLKKSKYWDVSEFIDYQKFDYEHFTDLFSNSVKKRSNADVEITAFLSGGLDSTAIVKEAKNYIKDIKTYSISNSNKDYDESDWIKIATQVLSLSNKTTEINRKILLDIYDDSINAYDEPFSDSSSIPTFLVSKYMSQISKVALSGDGGDELLGGYERYSWSSYNNLIPKYVNSLIDPLVLFLLSSKLVSHRFKQPLSLFMSNPSTRYESFFVDKEILSLLNLNSTIFPFKENYWVETKENFKSMQIADYKFYLPEVMMTKVDRASMANSLEVRSPFVDHHLIEYIISVSSKDYAKMWNRKIPLKHYLANDFDNSFINRKKMGFAIPLKQWLLNELKDEIKTNLADKDKFVYQQYGNISKVFFEHLENGNKVFSNRIWRLYLLNRYLT
tara:strand:- start:10085 stop:11905 length:1821 start_codon:yes stop_codon:yes gene_type:complete